MTSRFNHDNMLHTIWCRKFEIGPFPTYPLTYTQTRAEHPFLFDFQLRTPRRQIFRVISDDFLALLRFVAASTSAIDFTAIFYRRTNCTHVQNL